MRKAGLEAGLNPGWKRIRGIGGFSRLRGWQWVGLALGGLAFLELARAFTALFAPLVIDYCEMVVAGATEQLRAGGHLRDIYAPPAAPYGMPGIQYPPLFILLNTTLRNLTGLNPVTTERLLAWALYAGSGSLVGLIVWQETRQKWAAWLGAALPFCFWSVIIFVHAARVDPLALFLSLLTAYIYRRRTRYSSADFKTLALVSGLAVAAFLSKQTYLAVSAAIFFDLLLAGDKRIFDFRFSIFDYFRNNKSNVRGQSLEIRERRARGWRSEAGNLIENRKSKIENPFVFALCWLGWAGLGLGLFGWWSGGELFGIFEPARAGSFILQHTPGFVGFFVLDHLPLIGLGVAALVGLWRQGDRFWPLYGLFAALSCVAIIKDGAVDYYFNELAYVLSVAVALEVAKAAKSGRTGRITVALALQAVIALGMLLGWSHWKDFAASQSAYQQGLTLVKQAQATEAQGGKPALVLVDSFLLDTNHPEQIGDYFIYSILLSNHRRDATPLLNDLLNGRYGLIITENFLRWPPQVEAALANRYNLHIINGEDGRQLYWVYMLRP